MARKRRPIKFANSKQSLVFFAVSVTILLLMWTTGDFFSGNDDGPLQKTLDSEQIRAAGLSLYNANCMSCHGVEGRGTSFGPALTDPVYGAEALSDQAFAQAVTYGAPQTRWDYGAMAPIKGLTQTQIAQILAYVRAKQEVAKIQ